MMKIYRECYWERKVYIMSNLKNFYEQASKDEKVKAEIREVSRKHLAQCHDEIIEDYIKIAGNNGITIKKEDFENQVPGGELGASSGCIAIDEGCFVFGEINPHGGCIIIGVR